MTRPDMALYDAQRVAVSYRLTLRAAVPIHPSGIFGRRFIGNLNWRQCRLVQALPQAVLTEAKRLASYQPV